jgi:predicted CXXCH cytochrome family protein
MVRSKACGLAIAGVVTALAACAARQVYLPVPEAEAAAVVNPHRFRDGKSLCQACHVGGRADLKAEPVPLCMSCHRFSHGNHPVLVAQRPPPTDLPLWRGQVTCSSCHDEHQIGLSSRFAMRLAGDALCLRCHPR